MKYLCLIYEDEEMRRTMAPEERERLTGEYLAFRNDIRENGYFIAGHRLQSTSNGATVRVRNGRTSIVDGPYAETKEHLGGYFLIEAADLNHAIRMASRIPGARLGAVEVRPIAEIPGI